MKIRNGFVSNSSSSSFLIYGNLDNFRKNYMNNKIICNILLKYDDASTMDDILYAADLYNEVKKNIQELPNNREKLIEMIYEDDSTLFDLLYALAVGDSTRDKINLHYVPKKYRKYFMKITELQNLVKKLESPKRKFCNRNEKKAYRRRYITSYYYYHSAWPIYNKIRCMIEFFDYKFEVAEYILDILLKKHPELSIVDFGSGNCSKGGLMESYMYKQKNKISTVSYH